MKKLFLTLAIIAAVAGSSFASTNIVVPEILSVFKTDFNNAGNVQWVNKGKYLQVNFEQDGEKQSAYYYPDGEYMGTSKSVAIADLDGALVNAINKRYSGCTIEEVHFFDGKDEKAHYITINEGGKRMVLKGVGKRVYFFVKL